MMQKEFTSKVLAMPPVEIFIGDVIEENGTSKIEWLEDEEDPMLYDENQLAFRLRSARHFLINKGKGLGYDEQDIPLFDWENKENRVRWHSIARSAREGLKKLAEAQNNRPSPSSSTGCRRWAP